MSKNLDSLFNIDDLSKVKDLKNKISEVADETGNQIDDLIATSDLNKLNDIDRVLSIDIDGSDKEFDDLAKEALECYRTLIETGDNYADTRTAGTFYEAAVKMFGNALDAKNSKVNAKLKKMEILLKAQKIYKDKSGDEEKEDFTGKTIIASRSDILKAINKESDK